jgi:hypothetical protein
MTPTLNLNRLREACTLLLDQVEREHGTEMEVSNLPLGHYWEIDLRSSFAMVESPPIVAGDFVDDVESIEELVTRNPSEVYLWHDLGHLSGVLRGLAFLNLP